MSIKTRKCIVAGALLWALAVPVLATVTASVDRDQIDAGESVQLTLARDARGGEPDLAPLKRDFDVLGTSSGTSMQVVNGHFSQNVQYQITLAPKRSGHLTIPAVQWEGEQSQPLTVDVRSGSDAAAAGGSQHVFLTATIDNPQPYVQAASVLTVRLYADDTLQQASLQVPDVKDVVIQQLGQDRQTHESRNGRSYRVVERQYLVQAQRSGSFTLEGPVVDAQVLESRRAANDPFADPFFGGRFANVRPLRLRGEAINLEVKPRPANAKGRDWLPAQQIILSGAWNPDNGKLHVGEPLTLHLRLAATGLTGAQLPDLSTLITLPDGLKAYPDQAKIDSSLDDGQVLGTREQDIALIANQAGRYHIPELHLPWWNTKDDTAHEVVLPGRDIEILPAVGSTTPNAANPSAVPDANPGSNSGSNNGAPAASEAAASASQNPVPMAASGSAALNSPGNNTSNRVVRIWQWATGVLAALWVLTLLAWWISARRARQSPAPLAAVAAGDGLIAPAASAHATGAALAAAFEAFQSACLAHQAHAARAALLDWARAENPTENWSGLSALAQRLAVFAPESAKLLHELDRACYAGGTWRSDVLANAFAKPTALQGLRPTAKRTAAAALPELYR